MQSEHINYSLANLSKIGINGCNRYIKELMFKLACNGNRILGVNTDGIWYTGNIYHDENEGTELGQWKNDYTNCTWYAISDGCYYFIHEGKFNVRARGFYSYENYKDRDEWDKEDFFKAMLTQTNIMFTEEEGFICVEI